MVRVGWQRDSSAPLRCARNDMWEGRDGFPPPIFTGARSRREDNGRGRTPAATEGEG